MYEKLDKVCDHIGADKTQVRVCVDNIINKGYLDYNDFYIHLCSLLPGCLRFSLEIFDITFVEYKYLIKNGRIYIGNEFFDRLFDEYLLIM